MTVEVLCVIGPDMGIRPPTTIQQLRERLTGLYQLVEARGPDGYAVNDQAEETIDALDDVLTLLDRLEEEHKTQVARLALPLLETAVDLAADIKDRWQDLYDRCEAAQQSKDDLKDQA